MDLPRISEVEFIPCRPKGGLIGWAGFTLNNSIRLEGIGVHTLLNTDKIRLVYPDKILPNGYRIHIVRPIKCEVGLMLDDAVWLEIEELKEKVGSYGSRSRIK